MPVQEIPKAICPFCQSQAVLVLNDAEPGDLAACAKCTGVSILGEGMIPHPPGSPDEVRRIEYAVSNSLWMLLADGSSRS